MSNIDAIISVSGVARVYFTLSGWKWTNLDAYYNTSNSDIYNSYCIAIADDKSSFIVTSAGHGGGAVISEFIVILEYTKTTD